MKLTCEKCGRETFFPVGRLCLYCKAQEIGLEPDKDFPFPKSRLSSGQAAAVARRGWVTRRRGGKQRR